MFSTIGFIEIVVTQSEFTDYVTNQANSIQGRVVGDWIFLPPIIPYFVFINLFIQFHLLILVATRFLNGGKR